VTPARRHRPTVDELVGGVENGDRRVVAQAITLVESRRAADAADQTELLGRLAPLAESRGLSHRIGITGVPGVGKSSFLEAFATGLLDEGRRIAVLAVDPSSAISGGSVLGDKTRMTRLSHDQRAYVRPSPGAGELGGVARRTREAILVCEAAGFDTVFVETIGVGQSETAVRELVDTFVLLMLAGAGDELQGIKRGITELADVMVVTKADGTNVEPARRAARELTAALRLLHPSAGEGSWHPPVLTCSAHEGSGLGEVRAAIDAHRRHGAESGEFVARRRRQAVHWFERCVDDILRARLAGDSATRERLATARSDVAAGERQPFEAALWALGDTGASPTSTS
jgi:LAO/AO transport system kinase